MATVISISTRIERLADEACGGDAAAASVLAGLVRAEIVASRTFGFPGPRCPSCGTHRAVIAERGHWGACDYSVRNPVSGVGDPRLSESTPASACTCSDTGPKACPAHTDDVYGGRVFARPLLG